MDKYSLNYESLQSSMTQPKMYKLSDVQDKIEKVAFDVVRFMDGSEDIDKLWKIHQNDDGNEFIVAMYDDHALQASADDNIEKNAWHAALNKAASHVTVFYKGEPITKVAASEIDASPEEVSALCRHLPQRLATENGLVLALLNDLSEEERSALKERHPELLS